MEKEYDMNQLFKAIRGDDLPEDKKTSTVETETCTDENKEEKQSTVQPETSVDKIFDVGIRGLTALAKGAFKLGKGVYKYAVNWCEEVNKYKEKYAYRPDDYVMDRLQNTRRSEEKQACIDLLVERGVYKYVEWKCKYCGKRERRLDIQGKPKFNLCEARDFDEPHYWVEI